MTHAETRSLALAVLAALIAILLSACETAPTATAVSHERSLPAYQPRLVKTNFQTVRTTAYTHTESDHTQYGARNALGGILHPAGPANRRAEVTADDEESLVLAAVVNKASKTKSPASKPTKAKRAVAVTKKGPARIGSAAADWGRWPMGTTFRVLSTGQTYRIEDYGWALSGRNTIDLYMANRRDMNSWGARQEPIQILKWGDPKESLHFLEAKQQHKHIKRMVLELHGDEQAAASLQ